LDIIKLYPVRETEVNTVIVNNQPNNKKNVEIDEEEIIEVFCYYGAAAGRNRCYMKTKGV
jgi:hypothetical protein